MKEFRVKSVRAQNADRCNNPAHKQGEEKRHQYAGIALGKFFESHKDLFLVLAPCQRGDHAVEGVDLLRGHFGAGQHVFEIAHDGRLHFLRAEEVAGAKLFFQPVVKIIELGVQGGELFLGFLFRGRSAWNAFDRIKLEPLIGAE